MSNRRKSNMQMKNSNVLPPIVQDDDAELPFFKSDFFSDIGILVAQKKLHTSRCLLAYNSPVFEKKLATMKKQQDLDWSDRNFDDVIELLCYLDPRVPYTITVPIAKRLLPLAEEFEIRKLYTICEDLLFASYEVLRREHKYGDIPQATNEEYIVLADRFNMSNLLHMCIDEYVNNPKLDVSKSVASSEMVSDAVKILILEKKLGRLHRDLEKEKKYKHNASYKATRELPKTHWKR